MHSILGVCLGPHLTVPTTSNAITHNPNGTTLTLRDVIRITTKL